MVNTPKSVSASASRCALLNLKEIVFPQVGVKSNTNDAHDDNTNNKTAGGD